MATYGKKLLDINGNVILPKTRSSLVYMDNNSTVEDTINKIISGTTVVGKATKLTTARNIGNASFDGSGDITLAQIGAATTEQGTKADNAMPKSGGTFTGDVLLDCSTSTDGTKRNVAHNPFRVENTKKEFFRNILISQNSVYQEGHTVVIGSRE